MKPATALSPTVSRTKRERLKRGLLSFVFLWFFLGSIAHFVFTQAESSIVPPYIPYPEAAVYLSGVLEMLGALGLLWRRWRPLAGLGLFLLTIAVTPANINMAMNADRYPTVAPWLLDFRLVFQVILLGMIWWSANAGIRPHPWARK